MPRLIEDHKCHAIGCRVRTAPSHLMCPGHWRMVPDEIKSRVYGNYDPQQCKKLVRPSMEWLKAAREAIMAVNKQEVFQGAKP